MIYHSNGKILRHSHTLWRSELFHVIEVILGPHTETIFYTSFKILGAFYCLSPDTDNRLYYNSAETII